jgi:hypothetical protein
MKQRIYDDAERNPGPACHARTLIRASINLHKALAKRMDCRVNYHEDALRAFARQ